MPLLLQAAVCVSHSMNDVTVIHYDCDGCRSHQWRRNERYCDDVCPHYHVESSIHCFLLCRLLLTHSTLWPMMLVAYAKFHSTVMRRMRQQNFRVHEQSTLNVAQASPFLHHSQQSAPVSSRACTHAWYDVGWMVRVRARVRVQVTAPQAGWMEPSDGMTHCSHHSSGRMTRSFDETYDEMHVRKKAVMGMVQSPMQVTMMKHGWRMLSLDRQVEVMM